MKYWVALLILCAHAWLNAASAADAQNVVVYRNESMPFCGTVDARDAGIAVDILGAITRHGGPTFRYLSLPWARAQQYVQNQPGSAIIPFTRTASREPNHTWITELFSYELRITFAASPKHPVELPSTITEETLKPLRMGIIRASAHIPMLKARGFSNLIEFNDASFAVKMLQSGYIHGMIESEWVDSYHWKLNGFEPSELIIGPTLGETKHIYLAGARSFPQETAQAIERAMTEIRHNGVLTDILQQWR